MGINQRRLEMSPIGITRPSSREIRAAPALDKRTILIVAMFFAGVLAFVWLHSSGSAFAENAQTRTPAATAKPGIAAHPATPAVVPASRVPAPVSTSASAIAARNRAAAMVAAAHMAA